MNEHLYLKNNKYRILLQIFTHPLTMYDAANFLKIDSQHKIMLRLSGIIKKMLVYPNLYVKYYCYKRTTQM
jgi:hypothetical protein